MNELMAPSARGTSNLAVQAQQASNLLSPSQKAAVIIALLGADSAGPIVEKMQDRQLRLFINALGNIDQIPRPAMLSTVADFVTDMKRQDGQFKGGADVTKELVESLFNTERAARLFTPTTDVSEGGGGGRSDVWNILVQKSVSDLVGYLSGQRNEVVAIVLEQFPPAKTGELLAELPEDMSVFCVDKLSRTRSIDPETVDAIADLVQEEFLQQVQVDDGSEAILMVSEILSIVPKTRRDTVMEHLKKTDPEQAKKIQQGMMVFEDLPDRLPTTAIPIIFRDFDPEMLIKSLKAGQDAAPATTDFLFANISQRMAEQFKEQVEELPAMSEKEAEGAISAMMSYISKLEKDGRITLIRVVPETDLPKMDL